MILASKRCIMEPFLKTLAIADGRDKLTKGLQYLGKLIAWVLMTREKFSNNQIIPILERIAKMLSDARKIFRIGNWLTNVHKLGIGSNPKDFPNAVMQRIDMWNTIFGMASSFTDDMALLIRMWNGSPSILVRRLEIICNLCWTMSILCEFYMTAPKLFETYP
jgi:hypothetical protein